MTDIPLQFLNDDQREAIRAELKRLVCSGVFEASHRRQKFLEFIVGETLAGRGDRLKGYTIATTVFERPADFDASTDPVVRVEAGRLRDKLREYYDQEGKHDPVKIVLAKGSYRPEFQFGAVTLEQPSDSPLDYSSLIWIAPWRTAQAFAAAAIVFLAVVGLWRWSMNESGTVGKPSIAVLPFSNLGDDPAWTRFADGVTEDIVTDLSHSRELVVIARHSTEVYRDKPQDVRAVARDLGVKYVLEGSIQESSGQIRVTAQLIDATTGAHAWASRYDRPATDLFAVQRDVTEKIVATLSGYGSVLVQNEQSNVRRRLPGNLTAYENYLLGLEAKHGSALGVVSREGLDKAEALFNKALALDPQLARAYVALAYVYEYRIEFGLGSATDNLARHLEASRNAVRLDPNDGESQLALGHAYAYHGMAVQALDQFAKAEDLAPGNADVKLLIAWYLPQLDQPERGAALADKAVELNPNFPSWYNQGLRYAYFYGSQFEKSAKYSKVLAKPHPVDLAYLAAACAMTGDVASARTAAATLKSMAPDWSVERYLSDSGGYPDRMANLFVDAAAKAGVRGCIPAAEREKYPNLIPIKKCDAIRTASVMGQP